MARASRPSHFSASCLAPAGSREARALFEGRNLFELPDRDLRAIRGKEIAMIFQDPMTSLNPVLTIGKQIREVLEKHFDLDRKAADRRVAELLDQVGIPSAKARLKDYPHQFSGGMRQRAMIAMALACEPKLLIADEPTTALDVTIQAQILDLLRTLVRDKGAALIMITHDLGSSPACASGSNVMYAGTFVETGHAEQIFGDAAASVHARLAPERPAARCPAAARRCNRSRVTPRNMLSPPTSCPFAPRCRYRRDRCDQELPLLEELEPGHAAACFYPADADTWERSRMRGSGVSTNGATAARRDRGSPRLVPADERDPPRPACR